MRHWEVSIWTQNAAHYGIKMDGLSFIRHCTHIVSLLIDTGSKYVIIHGIHEESERIPYDVLVFMLFSSFIKYEHK